MKRAVLVVLGVLSLLLGLVLVAAGASVAALLGQDESLSTQPARMAGRGVALVAEHIRVDESSVPVPEGLGTLTLTVTAPDGRPMFAGTAKPADLDQYLTGAPYDVVVDLASGGRATTRPVPGTQQPAPPTGQTFWLESSSGTTATISSALEPGTALVVMNADGTPGVTADVVVTYRVAGSWVAAWIAVGVGVLLLLLAWLLFWRARVARRRRDARRAEEAAAAAASAAPAVSATTVLPAADGAAPEVPAWAAAPAALTGDELAGPPTGGLVVERSTDGAEAVVSAVEPPSAAPAPPEAGWYPGAMAAAAGGATIAAHDGPTADDASSTDGATADEPGTTASDDGATTEDAVHEPVPGAVTVEALEPSEPTASDDAVDTWHDETRPVPVVETAPAAPAAAGESATVYEELGSWFRDGSGPAADR